MFNGERLGLAGVWVLLLGALALAQGSAGASGSDAVVDAYRQRLEHIHTQIEPLTEAADLSARQIMARPGALLNVPLWEQRSFGDELVNRPGSLAHAFPTSERSGQATSNDVALLSVRAWHRDGVRIAALVDEYRRKGWRVTLIASANGRPRHLRVDHFIDNGAPDGSEDHAAINALANITLGWMWCAEYAGAMTRKGRLPAVLMDETTPEARDHNRSIQTPLSRHRVVTSETCIEPGALAQAYLAEVHKIMAAIESPTFISPLTELARNVASRMAQEQRVGIAGEGHFARFELMENLKAPWIAFHAGDGRTHVIDRHLRAKDTLVWFSDTGTSDGAALAQAAEALELEVLSIELASGNSSSDEASPERLLPRARLNYPLQLPDGRCTLPDYPARLGAISGLASGLTLRMLDAEVAARLAQLQPPAASSPQNFATQSE